MTEGCKQEKVAQKGGEGGSTAGWSLSENGAGPLESTGGVVPVWKLLSSKF